MTFAWPHLLWLLLAPAAFLVAELARRRREADATHPKILQAEADARRVALVARPAGAGRARPWLAVGVALAIVALARPQWGRIEEPVFDQSREILLAIDLSKSMLTPDVKPSRLERAKLLTQSLLEKLSGERVGLVVFSGTAFLQSPLSSDYEILREFLPALAPGFLPEGGTNYGALLDTTLDAFGTATAADRFLIVLSDGEATDEHWRDRLPELKKKGVRVIALGVGTAAGAMIPDGSGGLVKDERGAVVLSKLEDGTLRELADASGGTYRDASGWVDLAGVLNATVEAGRKGKFMEKNTVRLVERYQWPLAFAVWCLFVSFCYEFPVRPKPRALKLGGVPPAPAAKSAVSAVLMLLGAAALSPRARAEEPAPPVSAVALSKIVGRLAAAEDEARTARDWAELAQETVTWGSKLQSAGQPVPEGPVRDALQAVGLGSAANPKTADWPKLRQELEALLRKSEEQKQQQQQQKQDQKDQQQKENQQDSSKDQQPQQNPSKDQKDGSQKPESAPPQSKDSSDRQKKSEEQPKPQDQKQPPRDGSQAPSAFGDMKDQPPPPPPSQETQKVGGAPHDRNAAPPADPTLALPLQKLDQLRNQDSPAELFQLMDADKKAAPATKTKDW